jgi:hypothetical protein
VQQTSHKGIAPVAKMFTFADNDSLEHFRNFVNKEGENALRKHQKTLRITQYFAVGT